MLIAKTTRQDTVSTSSPPSGGPTAIAADVQAVQLPIAPARSDPPGKTSVMIASELGTSSAPATPCSARSPTRTSEDGATAHSADVTAKPERPHAKTLRRP